MIVICGTITEYLFIRQLFTTLRQMISLDEILMPNGEIKKKVKRVNDAHALHSQKKI